MSEAAYIDLERSGELAERARDLVESYRACRLCARRCGMNRLEGEMGICDATSEIIVSAAHPHFGEEAPLVGRHGSGTIFFNHCSLRCVFCQNWEIAHRGDGQAVSTEDLAQLMIELQRLRCHNINLVTPTHYVPGIIEALRIAIRLGLRVPLVYNCGGYESLEVLRLLDSIVDIYLPDFKYAGGRQAAKYSSGAKDYPEVAAAAIEEMHRQVGDLVVDEDGVAVRGLMVRHLIMPDNLAGTDRFLQFVAERLSASTYVNLMAQYRPENRAREYPELAHRITREEYLQARAWAREAGLLSAV